MARSTSQATPCKHSSYGRSWRQTPPPKKNAVAKMLTVTFHRWLKKIEDVAVTMSIFHMQSIVLDMQKCITTSVSVDTL